MQKKNHRSPSNLSRRDFLKASAVTVSGMMLAACVAPGAAPAGDGGAAPSAEGIALRLSAWADVQDAVVYENMVNAYQETVEGVNVSVEQYPGGYYEKIQANFAAGDSADVLYMQGWMWQAFAENEVLADLSDHISADGAEEFFPGGENYDNQTLWQGGRYMTPTDTGSLVIYYNKDLFDKKGVAHPQPGWKWEEFQADDPRSLLMRKMAPKYLRLGTGARLEWWLWSPRQPLCDAMAMWSGTRITETDRSLLGSSGHCICIAIFNL